VVALVTEHAHHLGGERVVEQLDQLLPIGLIALGDRALLEVLSRTTAQLLNFGEKSAAVGFHSPVVGTLRTVARCPSAPRRATRRRETPTRARRPRARTRPSRRRECRRRCACRPRARRGAR